jgi:hypothetical protein
VQNAGGTPALPRRDCLQADYTTTVFGEAGVACVGKKLAIWEAITATGWRLIRSGSNGWIEIVLTPGGASPAPTRECITGERNSRRRASSSQSEDTDEVELFGLELFYGFEDDVADDG